MMSLLNSKPTDPIANPRVLKWKPTILFLIKRIAQFLDPIDGKIHCVTWTYTRIASPELPIFYYKCSLKISGQKVSEGFAVGWSPFRVLKLSLAEAWERYWAERYSKLVTTELPRFTSSNGFAAGENAESSIKAAREELIERYIFLESWKNQSGWKKVEIQGFLAKAVESALRNKGWELTLFALETLENNKVLAGKVTHSVFGLAFDTIYIGLDSNRSAYRAREFKLILSLLKSTAFRVGLKIDSAFVLPEKGQPNDHAAFYSNSENSRAFDLLSAGTEICAFGCDENDSIRTSLIVDVTQMPAVAVAFNLSWGDLTWGRQSIRGKNLWPHPLA